MTVVELCSLPFKAMSDVCQHLSHIYYGESIPLLRTGQLIHGFFHYFSSQFDPHHVCQITESAIRTKLMNGTKFLSVIGIPTFNANIVLHLLTLFEIIQIHLLVQTWLDLLQRLMLISSTPFCGLHIIFVFLGIQMGHFIQLNSLKKKCG